MPISRSRRSDPTSGHNLVFLVSMTKARSSRYVMSKRLGKSRQLTHRSSTQSKGNHIWIVEAKKAPEKRWIFREFVRCIKGSPPPVAFIGLLWQWAPRVWDRQCAVTNADVVFHSPALPPWLRWQDNVLSGEAPLSAKGQQFDIEAVAVFQGQAKDEAPIYATCHIVVASATDDAGESLLFMCSFGSRAHHLPHRNRIFAAQCVCALDVGCWILRLFGTDVSHR